MFIVCSSIYFSAFKRLEGEEGFQEDPEDPDYEEGLEEYFVGGNSYPP